MNAFTPEYCEDGETPGLLGQIRGVTNHDNRTVKVSRAVNPTLAELVDTLAHELRHIEQPELDCGGRDVIGRGAPR